MLESWSMKKVFTILILCLLLSKPTSANARNIGNEMNIHIPNNYEYFEITFKQLISQFPEISSNDQIFNDFGIGINSKFIVVANNKKTIKFFNDLTSVSGLEKLNKKHLQPAMQKFSDPKLIDTMIKDLQKISPNADLNKMSDEEIMELMGELMQSPKMVKKYEKMTKPIMKKFNKEYNFEKYTVIIIGDKKAEILKEIKNKNSNDLIKETKKILEEIYLSTKDPSLKALKDLRFEIKRNSQGNLYFYTNDNVQSPYLSSRYNQEIFASSNNEKIVMIYSMCSTNNCDGFTDFKKIIQPTNLFPTNKITSTNSNSKSNVTEQLIQLNKLYESGALTKEEFTKAKKKLLN